MQQLHLMTPTARAVDGHRVRHASASARRLMTSGAMNAACRAMLWCRERDLQAGRNCVLWRRERLSVAAAVAG